MNSKDGSWLHSFSWIGQDDLIGELHQGWNHIPEHSDKVVKTRDIKQIHFTEGVPLIKPNCKYAEVYNMYLREVLNDANYDPMILWDI